MLIRSGDEFEEVWGLLPAYEGARAVDLTTGEVRPPVDVGCPGQDVRAIVPAPNGSARPVRPRSHASPPASARAPAAASAARRADLVRAALTGAAAP